MPARAQPQLHTLATPTKPLREEERVDQAADFTYAITASQHERKKETVQRRCDEKVGINIDLTLVGERKNARETAHHNGADRGRITRKSVTACLSSTRAWIDEQMTCAKDQKIRAAE